LTEVNKNLFRLQTARCRKLRLHSLLTALLVQVTTKALTQQTVNWRSTEI